MWKARAMEGNSTLEWGRVMKEVVYHIGVLVFILQRETSRVLQRNTRRFP